MLRNHFVFWVQVFGFVLPDCIAPVNTWIYDSDLKTLNYCDTKSYDATANIEQHGISTCGTDPPLFTATSVLGFVLLGCIAGVNTCIYESDMKTLNYCNAESYDATRNIEQHSFNTCGTDPPQFTAPSILCFVLPGCTTRVNNCIYESYLKILNYCKTESYDASRNIEQQGISTCGNDPPLFTATSVTWAAAATLMSHCFKSSHVSFSGTGHGHIMSEVMLRHQFVFLVQVLGFVLLFCIARVKTCIYVSDMKTLNYCKAESYDATRNIEQHGFSTCGTDPPQFTAPSVLCFVLPGCITRVNNSIYESYLKILNYCKTESYDASRNIEQQGISTCGTDPPLLTATSVSSAAAATLTSHCFESCQFSFFGTAHGGSLSEVMWMNHFVLCVQVLGFVLPGCIARVNTCIYGSDVKTLNYCNTETYDATRNIEQNGISTCGTDPPLLTATSVSSAASCNIDVLGFVLPGCIARVNTCLYDSGLKTLNYSNTETNDGTRNIEQHGISTYGTDPPMFMARAVTSAAAATLTSHCFKSSHVSFFGIGDGGNLTEVMLTNNFGFLDKVLGFVLQGCIARVNTCIYDSDLKTLNYCNTESYDATRNIEQNGISTCGTDPPLLTATSVSSAASCNIDVTLLYSESTFVFWHCACGTLDEMMLRDHFVFLVHVVGFVLPGCIARVNTCIYDSDLKTLNYCNTESYDATMNIEQHGITTYETDPPLFTAPSTTSAAPATLTSRCFKSVSRFVLWNWAWWHPERGCITRVNNCIYESYLKILNYCKTKSYDATRNIEQHGISTCGTDPPLFTATSILCFVLPGCITRVNNCIYESYLKILNYCKTESYDASRNIEQQGISTCGNDPPLFTATSVTWAAAATLMSHCFKSSHVSFSGTGHGHIMSEVMLRHQFVFLVQVLGFVLLFCIARVKTCIYVSDMKKLNYCKAESYDATRNIEQHGFSTCGTDPPQFTAPSVLCFVLPGCITRVNNSIYESYLKILNYCKTESYDASRNIEQQGISTCGTDPPLLTATSVSSAAAATLTSHCFESCQFSFFGTAHGGSLSEVMWMNHFVLCVQVLGFVLPGCIAPVNTWIYDSDLKTLKYCDTKSYDATRNIDQNAISTCGTDPPALTATSL
ncbi:hypothetical protein V5799_001184 [Amblyomma americanum]|uniref:FZ domain-containing protein n=1 Tax=Amblyomma americanum TaxID=6943 RepID=A0AAQ4D0Y1_AMBAM